MRDASTSRIWCQCGSDHACDGRSLAPPHPALPVSAV